MSCGTRWRRHPADRSDGAQDDHSHRPIPTHAPTTRRDSSAAACSPFLAPAKAASSQRSAGTVSGGAPEVAQQPRRGTAAAAASATASLKRPLSSLDLGGLDLDQDSQTSSQGYSKSARSSREATPARQRAAAQRARAAWADGGRGDESGDEAGSDLDSRSGLDFLLRACEMLDPHGAARWVPPPDLPQSCGWGVLRMRRAAWRSVRGGGGGVRQ